MDENEFVEKFENMSLPADKFNHKGHLWLAWLYIRNYNLAEASRRLNHGIKAFAESLGAKDKFHLTITTTLACAIKSRFKEAESFDEFLTSNDDLVHDALAIIQKHYSPELLFSEDAKTRLVKPDRLPFPQEYENEIQGFF